MKLKYVGPHSEVVIEATGDVCKHGDTVDIADENVAKSLAKQSTWEQPGKAAPSTKSEKE